MARSKAALALPMIVAVAVATGCGGPDEQVSAGAAPFEVIRPALGSTATTTFAGTAVNGLVPQVEAKVGMFPPSTLQVRVKNLGLSDGTVLTVSLAGYDVGTMKVARAEGAASIPIGFQVGINSALALRNGTAILAYHPMQ